MVSARVFVTPLQEEIAGGARREDINKGYHPPRESSIALSREGPNLVGRRGRSTRAKKRRTQSIFIETRKETIFFDVSASDERGLEIPPIYQGSIKALDLGSARRLEQRNLR